MARYYQTAGLAAAQATTGTQALAQAQGQAGGALGQAADAGQALAQAQAELAATARANIAVLGQEAAAAQALAGSLGQAAAAAQQARPIAAQPQAATTQAQAALQVQPVAAVQVATGAGQAAAAAQQATVANQALAQSAVAAAAAEGLLGVQAANLVPSIDRAVRGGDDLDNVLHDLQRSGALEGGTLQELTAYYQRLGEAATQAAEQQATAARQVPAATTLPPAATTIPATAAIQPEAAAGAQQVAAADQALTQSAVAAAAAQTQLGAATAATGTSAGSSAAGMARLGGAAAEVAGSSRTLNAAFAQFEPLATQQQRIVQALAAGYLDAETAAQAWVAAERGAAEASHSLGTGINSVFTSIGQRNFALTNVSEQIRQFIEQISFGTSPLQAFAQQAPQALVGFGPWAAVIGVAAAAVGGLVAVLPGLISGTTDAAKAAKDQETASDALLKALGLERDGVLGLSTALGGLTAAQSSIVGGNLKADLDTQSAAFDAAAKKATDYGKSLNTGGFSAIIRNIAPNEFAIPSQQDLDALKAFGDASTDLQNRIQALGAGAGSFDTVAEAIRRMGDAQREGGDATAKQRIEVEQQIDKLAPLAAAEEAARQSLLLHTAQVHEFLAAMGQTGAITAFDEQILNQAEVARQASAALKELNTNQRLVIASQVADRIRASGIPNAGQEADAYLTREAAKGPAEQFQRTQETRQAEATIVFKGDTSQAQKALDLLKQAGTNVGESFEQTEQRLTVLGQQLGTPFPVVQSAIEKARTEADKLIVSQHQAAVVQALVNAGFTPEKAQAQAAAIASGNQGLESRARVVAEIGAAEQARDALAARGPAFAREQAAAAQNVLQLQGQLRQIDQQRSDTAQRHADQIARQREGLLAQAGPEAALLQAEQQRAQALKEGVLKSPAEVQQSLQGAYRSYADTVAQQAGQGAAGLPERERLQAQINAEMDAETRHGEARVAIDQKIVELRGQIAGLDTKDADALEQQNAKIEKGLTAQAAQLAKLQASGGGAIRVEIDQAREAAAAQVPLPTRQEQDSPAGGVLLDQRLSQRQQASDTAEQIVLQQQYNAVLSQVQTPLGAYVDQVSKLAELYDRGKLSFDQYARAVTGITTPEQQHADALALIGGQLRQVDNLYATGGITLQRRTQLLAALTAQQGREAAAERQSQIAQLEATGDPGSGATTGRQIGAGAQAAGLQYVEQYGNVAKQTAGFLTNMADTGIDAFAQLATGAKVNLAEIVQSLEQMAIKMTLQIALARALNAALGGGAQAAAGLSPVASIQQPGGNFVQSPDIMSAYGHTGGLVDTLGNRRSVDPMLFASAPRYHSGGTVGLQPDEVPIIARRGERVLTPEQQQGSAAPTVNINVTNNAGADVSVGQPRRGADGSFQLDVMLERQTNNAIARGRHDKAMQSRFDVPRRLY